MGRSPPLRWPATGGSRTVVVGGAAVGGQLGANVPTVSPEWPGGGAVLDLGGWRLVDGDRPRTRFPGGHGLDFEHDWLRHVLGRLDGAKCGLALPGDVTYPFADRGAVCAVGGAGAIAPLVWRGVGLCPDLVWGQSGGGILGSGHGGQCGAPVALGAVVGLSRSHRGPLAQLLARSLARSISSVVRCVPGSDAVCTHCPGGDARGSGDCVVSVVLPFCLAARCHPFLVQRGSRCAFCLGCGRLGGDRSAVLVGSLA